MKKVVFIGEEIANLEEFLPGKNTYEDNGKIYASTIGTISIDMKERKINVIPKNDIPEIKENDIVIGVVEEVKEKFIIVNILKKKGAKRSFPKKITGLLHISKIKNGFVSDIAMEFNLGDIILAKVVNSKRTPVLLSTMEDDFGVIKAFCYACNTPLTLNENKLKCERCGRVEVRKISKNYGKGINW